MTPFEILAKACSPPTPFSFNPFCCPRLHPCTLCAGGRCRWQPSWLLWRLPPPPLPNLLPCPRMRLVCRWLLWVAAWPATLASSTASWQPSSERPPQHPTSASWRPCAAACGRTVVPASTRMCMLSRCLGSWGGTLEVEEAPPEVEEAPDSGGWHRSSRSMPRRRTARWCGRCSSGLRSQVGAGMDTGGVLVPPVLTCCSWYAVCVAHAACHSRASRVVVHRPHRPRLLLLLNCQIIQPCNIPTSPLLHYRPA